MPVSHEISRFNRCVFGLSSWLNTMSSTFSVFSLTHTERGLPLPGCRSIVPALRIIFNRVKILPHFWALVMSLSDRYLDWKNLCVNKILFNAVYSQKKQYVAYSEIGHFLCSVISQGKVVALDRWGGKWNHLSMTHRLATNYAKNYCNRTPIVKVIVENVVTCFLGDTVYIHTHKGFAENSTGGCYGDYKNSLKTMKQKVQ